ncbi:MAG: IS1182 family transposase [Bdellovibrionales bacterium]|nr:IS1182 family transposase [Bdellovibrionales bacterium]
MTKKFRDWSPEQSFLLPPSVQDFVPAEHISHFIRDLVKEELDLGVILNEYPEERGYPPYDPRMMTAILLYSYSQGIYSSRKIARACAERLDFMAVSAMNQPDYRTVSKFRKRHLSALGGLFVQVLNLCKQAGLVKLGHVALDGSKVKANASKRRSKSYSHLRAQERVLREEVSSWFTKADAVDAQEDELYGQESNGDEIPEWMGNKALRLQRIREARKSLENKDRKEREDREKAEKKGKKPPSKAKKRDKPTDSRKYNFTDPDSEMLKTRDGFIQGYNTQVAVDIESYVIVSSDVCNARNDLDQLIPTLDQIENNLGKKARELSADAGYCSEENLKELQMRKVRGYIALGSGPPGEREKRIEPHSLVYQMSQRLKRGGKRSRYRFRKMTVEPVFGVIKSARGFQQFFLRGLQEVKNEWLMVCTAHNLHKLAAAR